MTKVNRAAHSFEGWLNGEIAIYCKKTDGSDPDKPAIMRVDVKRYRFVSNSISGNSFSKEDARISPRSSGDYLPDKDDFEAAYRKICSPRGEIAIDSVLDQIEKDAINKGHFLRKNWRLITERNIAKWSKK